jgi:hypothetical protein
MAAGRTTDEALADFLGTAVGRTILTLARAEPREEKVFLTFQKAARLSSRPVPYGRSISRRVRRRCLNGWKTSFPAANPW